MRCVRRTRWRFKRKRSGKLGKVGFSILLRCHAGGFLKLEAKIGDAVKAAFQGNILDFPFGGLEQNLGIADTLLQDVFRNGHFHHGLEFSGQMAHAEMGVFRKPLQRDLMVVVSG